VLADSLRDRPALIELCEGWSAHPCWTPGAYVEGTEVGWLDRKGRYVWVHPDRRAAVADFIDRLAVAAATGIRRGSGLASRIRSGAACCCVEWDVGCSGDRWAAW
jgi:hypothetical protein